MLVSLWDCLPSSQGLRQRKAAHIIAGSRVKPESGPSALRASGRVSSDLANTEARAGLQVGYLGRALTILATEWPPDGLALNMWADLNVDISNRLSLPNGV